MATSFNLIRNPANRESECISSPPAQSGLEDAVAATGDSSQPPSQSATVVGQHEHLLTQILVKLPSKSLLRFQCVSKNWLSLISDPAFRRRWGVTRKNVNPNLLFFNSGIKQIGINFISLDSERLASAAGVFNSDPINDVLKASNHKGLLSLVSVHCCNGLWCVQIGHDFMGASLVVCNPTTWKHRVITVPMKEEDGTLSPTFLRYSNMAFDPMKSDHYKLVCAALDGMDFRFMVYSSESANWTVTNDQIGNITMADYEFDNGIFWNGDMHFIGSDESGKHASICFDVQNEKIRSSMPRIPTNSAVGYFGEAGEDLCLLMMSGPNSDVFALKRDYSEWTLKYRVDFAPLTARYPRSRGYCISCFVVRGKKAMFVMTMDGKVVSFDIGNTEIDELVEFGGQRGYYKASEVFEHVECFAMV